jgi:hypothetical protein
VSPTPLCYSRFIGLLKLELLYCSPDLTAPDQVLILTSPLP